MSFVLDCSEEEVCSNADMLHGLDAAPFQTFILAEDSTALWNKPVDYRALEVFAGSKNLSSDLAKHGIATDTIELKDGSAANNFALPGTAASVINKIRAGVYSYVHLAPPCNTFSRARFPAVRPHGRTHTCNYWSWKKINEYVCACI